MFSSNASRFVKFVTLNYSNSTPYPFRDKHGRVTHVNEAHLIRLLAQGLRAGYEVFLPPDGSVGARQADGAWNDGMLGMVKRSEADLAMGGLTMTEERLEAFNFSYPLLQSEIIFMANKPQPQAMKSAIFLPFSYEIWIVLLVFSVTASLLFYGLTKRKNFQYVALNILGSLLQQSMNFDIRSPAFSSLAIAWLLGIFVITNSYKAVLLSFMSIPSMTGIRDISELHRASLEDSFKCFTFKGVFFIKTFSESNDEAKRAVGKCLRRTEIAVESSASTFYNTQTSQKVFLASRIYLAKNARNFFLSEESFSNHWLSIVVSKNFCCKKNLNHLIHRLVAAGLVDKIKRDEELFEQISIPIIQSGQTDSLFKRIGLEDISSALFMLVAGWLLALVTLFAEIVVGRRSHKRK